MTIEVLLRGTFEAPVGLLGIEGHVGLAESFPDVPDSARIGREKDRVTRLDFELFAALRREKSAAGDEVAEFSLHDLAAPDAGGTLPNSSLNLFFPQDDSFKTFKLRYRFAEWDGYRADLGQRYLCDIANQDWRHGGSLDDGWQTSFLHWIYHDRSASDKHVQNGGDFRAGAMVGDRTDCAVN
jgi:hypothetical protein